jgi:hypothetical protein
MPTRYSPDSLGFAVTEVITDPKKHSLRRMTVSYMVLQILYEAAKGGRVANGVILALGSTLQARRGNVHPKQYAHQVLRELSIDHVPIHLIPTLSVDEAASLAYCNSSVSVVVTLIGPPGPRASDVPSAGTPKSTRPHHVSATPTFTRCVRVSLGAALIA